MSDFTRRPFLMGNTGNPVFSQPEIRASVAKDSSGEFASLPLPSELVIETENPATSGGISAVFTAERTMSYILAQINAALSGYATAVEYEGCLVIRTDSSGDGSYIRIHSPISGFDDAAAVLGLPVHPNPTATVRSGDLLDTPVRPDQEDNPVGTKMVGTGEDRVGTAYNRGLQALGRNLDTLHSWLTKPVPTLVDVIVDETAWAAYLDVNADGTIDQINLAGVAATYPSLGGRFYVGAANNLSTLDELAEFWGVLDLNHNEIPAGDRTVRIGCVTRGQRGSRPTWADDTSAPASPVGDTTGVAVDGGNALGVDRVKHTPVNISEVRQNTVIYCSGATFVTNGVVAGDIATITGAAVSSPFNHNGTHVVDVVVGEEILVLRPDPANDSVEALNPATGNYGSVAISSGGDWEEDLWVTFEPPLPRFPADGKIRLILPLESSLGSLPAAALAAGDIRSAEEVDGWVLYNLWKQLSFEGVYQGQGLGQGGGYRGRVTHRPVTFVNEREGTYSSGSVNRGSSGAAELDTAANRLTVAATDSFTSDDVGKTIILNAVGLLAGGEPWTITRYVDRATVDVAPPIFRTGEEAAGTLAVTSWIILDDDVIDLPSVIRVISPEYFGQSDTDAAHPGVVYIREQRDEATANAPVPGMLSFLHLEKIRLIRDTGNETVFTAPAVSGDTVTLPFDPENDTSNIYADVGDTKTYLFQGSITFCRILQGDNAGLYRIYKTNSVTGTGTDSLELRDLEGNTPTFAAEANVACCLYNANFSVGAPAYAGPATPMAHVRAGVSAFVDGHEAGLAAAYAIRATWRGEGSGLFIVANDPDFKGFDGGDGAEGPAIFIRGFAPADGIDVQVEGADSGSSERRATFGLRVKTRSARHVLELEGAPPASGTDFGGTHPSETGWIAQAGGDPALIITKHVSTSAECPSTQYSKLTASAALLIGKAGSPSGSADYTTGVSGRGSAVEQRGSTWIYRADPDSLSGTAEGWAEGGLFSEDVVGAGRWLFPSMGIYESDDSPYWGDDATHFGWDGPTQLGAPGQLIPAVNHPAYPAQLADIDVADFNEFNIPHEAVVTVDVSTGYFEKPWVRYVGQRFRVVESGHEAELEEFVIQAVKQTGTNELKLALHHETSGLITAPAAGIEVQVLGQRWWASHIDLASFMHIGTMIEDDLYLLPILDLGSELGEEVVEGMDPAVLWVGVGGLLSHPSYIPDAAGAGIGIVQDLASMTNVSGLNPWPPNTYTFEWHQEYEILHEWAQDAHEPRTPFPNAGVIAGEKLDGDYEEFPMLFTDNPGNLLSQDLALEHVTKNTAYGAVVHWCPVLGGSLAVRTHVDNNSEADPFDQTDTVRLWKRGVKYVNPRSFAFKVRLKFAIPGGFPLHGSTRIITALRNSDGTPFTKRDGTELLEDETILTYGIQELEYEWTYHDLTEAPFSELDVYNSLVGDEEGWHLTVDIEVPEGAGAVPATWVHAYLLEFRIEELSRPARISHGLEVAGVLKGTSHRYMGLVPGGQAVGPAEVSLLEEPAFGRGPSSSDEDPANTEYVYGNREGKGVGFFRGKIGQDDFWLRPSYDASRFFQKGRHSATVELFHPFYDPLWYYQAVLNDWTEGALLSAGVLAYISLPGTTGFIIPFSNVPHGALLTRLDWNLSFRSGWSRASTLVDSSEEKYWGIYRKLPSWADAGEIPDAQETWQLRDNWEDRAGVMITLWRYNTCNIGLDYEWSGTTYTGQDAPASGPEKIWEYEVDLSQETPPADEAAVSPSSATNGDPLMQEHKVQQSLDFLSDLQSANALVNEQLLRADRRQYTYFATISFYGGPRYAEEETEPAVKKLLTYGLDNSADYTPAMSDTGGFTQVDVTTADYPFDRDDSIIPPAVRFRGMRLNWVTDRVGEDWG